MLLPAEIVKKGKRRECFGERERDRERERQREREREIGGLCDIENKGFDVREKM